MTIQNELGRERKFVCAILPWLVAAAALVLYLLTFNSWVSLNNLGQVATTAGWSWGAEVYAPLFYLLTYPFRWLPASWVPLALDLFSMVCAVLTLALLARSVALLPQDRTREQRIRERSEFSLLSVPGAWIPPVLATALCGLTLTFWEDATTGASNMLDLLLLAYVIRCLLEYRITWEDSWLMRAALASGAGMANSWLMFCLFPAFLVCLVWIKGFSFFDFRFLSKMLFCGAAGALLYLLLPLIYTFSANATGSFWDALKLNLGGEKQVLLMFVKQLPGSMLVLLATTSLLPLLLIGIRWPSNFGDTSRTGGNLATWIVHLACAAFFAVCVWVAFDPGFSPRQNGFPIAAFYYLAALSVGYFSGYFLLVFTPAPSRIRRRTATQEWLNRISHAVIWALLILVPVGLLYENLPSIRVANGPALKRYAALLTQSLPEKCVVLSDDARKLYLAQAWMTRSGKAADHTFLNTQLLEQPDYYRDQLRIHPGDWLPLVEPNRTNKVAAITLVRLLVKLSENRPIYYLHPSFGYYFEFFYPQPHGLAFELERYPTNAIAAPALTEAQTVENDAFWKENEGAMDSLVPFVAPPAPGQKTGFRQALLSKLHIPFEANATAVVLASYYSQGLDAWGVRAQRAGRLKEAGRCFDLALDLNPQNVIARINSEFNKQLQDGQQESKIQPLASGDAELGKYKNWLDALRDNGPWDEPSHCFAEAQVLAQSGLLRQATLLLQRASDLVPDDLLARYYLARLYLAARLPEKSLRQIAEIQRRADSLTESPIPRLDLLQTKALALFSASKDADAETLLQDAITKNPGDTNLLSMVVQVCSTFGRYTNALFAVEKQLQIQPNNPVALINKGFLNVQTGNSREAIEPLSQALALEPTNDVARLDRAIAYLDCSKLDEAQQDYEALEKTTTNQFQVFYGLGEIAYRKKDTNAAIHFYQLYLSNAPANPDEVKMVSERLESLKGDAR